MKASLVLNKSQITHFFYGILLFASLFMFFYPEQYVFLPFSTIRITQILGILVCVLLASNTRLHRSVGRIIAYGFIIFFIGLMASKVFSPNGDLDVAKRGILMCFHLFSSFFIAYCLKKTVGGYSFYSLLEWLIYITIFQAIVSLIFYLIPSIYETYKSFIILDDFNDSMTEMAASYRLMSVGALRYATAASQYGLILWALILLHEKNIGFWGRHEFIYSLVVALFCIAGLLSGRVFFVMIPVTFLYIFFLKKLKLRTTIKTSIKTFLPVIIIAVAAFVYLFAENEVLIEWVFELFINLGDSGTIESASTNQLKEMYVFPDNIKTWIIGDGLSVSSDGGFYMGTDVGYVRSLFYWGIFGTAAYYIIQYLCYKNIVRLGIDDSARTYILFILIWLLIYSFKDFYSIDKFLVLFTVILSLNQKEKTYNRSHEIHDSNTSL